MSFFQTRLTRTSQLALCLQRATVGLCLLLKTGSLLKGDTKTTHLGLGCCREPRRDPVGPRTTFESSLKFYNFTFFFFSLDRKNTNSCDLHSSTTCSPNVFFLSSNSVLKDNQTLTTASSARRQHLVSTRVNSARLHM